jgi:hypothetical protein
MDQSGDANLGGIDKIGLGKDLDDITGLERQILIGVASE